VKDSGENVYSIKIQFKIQEKPRFMENQRN